MCRIAEEFGEDTEPGKDVISLCKIQLGYLCFFLPSFVHVTYINLLFDESMMSAYCGT